MKKIFLRICLLILLFSSWHKALLAQENDVQLSAFILHQDSLFWQAYNACDIEKLSGFFSEDVEFYHDKGGPTIGHAAMMEAVKNGLCNESGITRLRREAVEGSVKVFPLKKAGVIYGAIISGEHVFYILEKGKNEQLDGLAKFNHLWLKKDSVWKMYRILTYDHGPATYINKRKEITLSGEVLGAYAGKYRGPKSGVINILASSNGQLNLLVGNRSLILYAEKENLFFMKERDLTFEFIKGSDKGSTKLIVRERGEVAEELSFFE